MRLTTLVFVPLTVLLTTVDGAAQGLTSAEDRNDADIFLSGALSSATNADTVYQWDAKLTYPRVERRVRRSDHWLVLSPRVEFTANKGTNANPDRILLAGSGELHAFTFKTFGRHIPYVVWTNVLGGEFDREFATKALTYHTSARLAFGTVGPRGATVPVAFVPRLEGGVELGSNLSNRLQDSGSGRVARLYAGATANQELGFTWLSLSLTYQFRKPFESEVFLHEAKPGTGLPHDLRLTKEARHYVEIAPQVRVGSWFSLKPTYKRGSLPPAFNYVDNEFSLSLQFAAKAVTQIK